MLGKNPWTKRIARNIKQENRESSPEHLALFDTSPPAKYLILVGRMYSMGRSDAFEGRSEELLSLLQLTDVEKKKLTVEYSTGVMKKEARLGAALLPNPELLFLDEPFEGVDAITRVSLRDRSPLRPPRIPPSL